MIQFGSSVPLHEDHGGPSALFDLKELQVPQFLPADLLIDAHSLVSTKLGATAVRDLESRFERSSVDEVFNYFRGRLHDKYSAQIQSDLAGILIKSRKIEVLPSGDTATSFLCELRSRAGYSMLPNGVRLYELKSGPAFIWVRDSAFGFQATTLFSDQAFYTEMNSIKELDPRSLNDPKFQPLLLSHLVSMLSGYGQLPFKIDSLTLDILQGRAELKLESSLGPLLCQIVHLPQSYNILYRIKGVGRNGEQ